MKIMVQFINQVERFMTDSMLNFSKANEKHKLSEKLTDEQMVAVRGFYKFIIEQLELAKGVKE
jgi:site-specific recombinase XerD